MPGPSLKQAIAWTGRRAAPHVAATLLLARRAGVAQAASDTSQKVGDEAKGWLTVLFLVVAGFRCVAGDRSPDVGRGLRAGRARADPRRAGVRAGRRPRRDPQHLVVDRLIGPRRTTHRSRDRGAAVDDSGKVVIRSFRLVFDRGYRRLFKIDRYRLPFAYGVPMLGIGYAALVRWRWCSPRGPAVGEALARCHRRSTGSRSRWASRW